MSEYTKDAPVFPGYYWLRSYRLPGEAERRQLHPHDDPVVVSVPPKGTGLPTDFLFPGNDIEFAINELEQGEWSGPLNPGLIPPIDMLLFCPNCGAQHIDLPQAERNWDNPPHRSHECQHCLWVWRPADVPTNGVKEIQTKGKLDRSPVPPRY